MRCSQSDFSEQLRYSNRLSVSPSVLFSEPPNSGRGAKAPLVPPLTQSLIMSSRNYLAFRLETNVKNSRFDITT